MIVLEEFNRAYEKLDKAYEKFSSNKISQNELDSIFENFIEQLKSMEVIIIT